MFKCVPRGNFLVAVSNLKRWQIWAARSACASGIFCDITQNCLSPTDPQEILRLTIFSISFTKQALALRRSAAVFFCPNRGHAIAASSTTSSTLWMSLAYCIRITNSADKTYSNLLIFFGIDCMSCKLLTLVAVTSLCLELKGSSTFSAAFVWIFVLQIAH